MPSKLIALDQRLQVAALPWRENGGELELMLITSRLSRHWLIPKGWPMKRKTPAAAAAQEAFEEAGIQGAIGMEPLGRYSYDKLSLEASAVPCVVEVYPLHVEVELTEWPEAATRTRSWMTVGMASQLAYETGLSALLDGLDSQALLNTLAAPRRKKSSKR